MVLVWSVFSLQSVFSLGLAQDASCYVNTNRLNVRAGPGVNYRIMGQITNGTAFLSSGRNDAANWIYGSSEATVGWVAARFLVCPSIQTLPTIATPIIVPVSTPGTPSIAPVVGLLSSVTLLEPLEKTLQGRLTFRWQVTNPLNPGQYYEVVFWPADSDPIQAGFGIVESTVRDFVTVDLDAVAASLPHLLRPGESYVWGVLLVEREPYTRKQLLSNNWRFKYEREIVGSNAPDAPATATLLPSDTPIAPPTALPTATATETPTSS